MTRQEYRPIAFSATAARYAATMSPALTPVAAEVVRRAMLLPGETVLDVGTGIGTAARLASGSGRRIIGLDAAAGMLELARAEAPQIEWMEADFGAIPIDDGSLDVVIGVHALLFAPDRVAALREWCRVTRLDGRLSISVPGPGDVVPSAVFGEVYARYHIVWHVDDYPRLETLAGWAETAGWADVETWADPTAVVELPDEAAFRTWLGVGRPQTDWSPDQVDAFARDLMAICPRGAHDSFRIPFGALYLTARRPS